MRQTGASVETAKEVKIFGLQRVPDRALPRARRGASTRANRTLAIRRAGWGGAAHRRSAPSATTSPTPSSPGARCAASSPSATSPSSPAPSGACATCSRGLLIGFSQVAGQALYLDDLFSFFEIQPEIVSPPNPRPFPAPIREGFTFEDVGFRYPGAERWAVRHLTLHAARRRGAGAGRRERRRQDDAREAAGAPLRPRRGPHPARRPRPARVRPRRAARQHRRDLPGLRALPPDRRREHRGRPHRGARRPRAHRGRRRAQPRRRGDRDAARAATTR